MRVPVKIIGAFVVALLLAMCGHGAASRGPATFRPQVTHDVDFAFGVNLDKEQAFKVVDTYSDLVLDTLKAHGEFNDTEIAEAKGKIAAFKEDPFWNAPEGMRAFLEKSGLRNAEYRWVVLSLADFKMVAGKPSLGGLSLALAGTIDLDKFISACRQEDDCDVIFEKTQVEDETAWHIVPEKAKDVREMKELHIDPYVTSLDGRLVLVATSRETLARQIRLYRSGSGKGDALDGFSASNGELVHLHLSDIGGILRKYVPRHNLKKLNFIRGGDELALGLEDLDISLNVTTNGMLRDSLRLVTASEKDANALRGLSTMGIGILGLMMLNDQKSKDRKAANLEKKISFGEIQVGGTGRQFEIRGGFTLAVVAGVLSPAVSSAMLNAKMSEMAINGRKLIQGMIQANVERQGKSAGPIWPRTDVDKDRVASTDDIASHDSKSATDYFKALFDIDHYGSADWDPSVEGDLLSTLSGAGVPGMSGKTLTDRNIAWNIAANVTDETPDFMPVLITANFNPKLLAPGRFDGMDDTPLPIGPTSGAAKSMFGDKAIVIVRKSGAAETVKKKDLTYNVLYKKQAFDLTNMNPPIKYLTPSGVVEPVGHKQRGMKK